jgi:hypothetical protein
MLSRREALLGVLLAPLVKPVAAILPKKEWKGFVVENWRVSSSHPYSVGDRIAFGDTYVTVVWVGSGVVTVMRRSHD